MLLPVKLMLDRVELARGDGDTTLFLHLLYAGEMLVKIIAPLLLALSLIAEKSTGTIFYIAQFVQMDRESGAKSLMRH